ncbi:hypothetical protein GCM10009840_17990 [Pseudolysinimonas kribbensis]|uniref:AAA family ATPase n=1 Tax=Pseudolysinimonas kribbensis TaxID=433641 RepID=A0ABQ6K306_9MICO|nr:AAA family ATPase [Pseudolysinimonas kribbensis]GMA93819.1 hypothetical protein GCM10025881_06430 [Pseudolysinimonas kribbensis]
MNPTTESDLDPEDIVLDGPRADSRSMADQAEAEALVASAIADLMADMLPAGSEWECDSEGPTSAEEASILRRLAALGPRTDIERAEAVATRMEARGHMASDDQAAARLLGRAGEIRAAARQRAHEGIDARLAVGSIDRRVAKAEHDELAARLALWDANPSARPAAEAAHDQADAELKAAHEAAAAYAELMTRAEVADAERGSRADIIARAVELADAFGDAEYQSAQATIEAGRQRARMDGARALLEAQGGFGLFDPSAVGTLEALVAGTETSELVAGVLGRGELAILFGDSYTGKSFLALDWGLSIAHGAPWLGREVPPGRVLYVAMEGAATLHKREVAWASHRGLPTTPAGFVAYPRVVNLLHEASALALAEYVAVEGFDLVVIDTLSRSINGADENSSAEMGAYVAALGRIKEAADGCSVLVLHHSRKGEPEVMRGSTALFAGVDRVLCWRLDSKGQDRRKLLTQKDKSGAPTKPIHAAFKQVAPSAVLVPVEGAGDDTLVMALRNLLATGGAVMRTEFQRRLVAEGLKPTTDAARMAVKREIEAGRMHEVAGALLLGEPTDDDPDE